MAASGDQNCRRWENKEAQACDWQQKEMECFTTWFKCNVAILHYLQLRGMRRFQVGAQALSGRYRQGTSLPQRGIKHCTRPTFGGQHN